MSTVKYVVIYESGDDVRAKAPIHFPADRARWQAFRDRGELLMSGTFSDLSGAMGIFTSRSCRGFRQRRPVRSAGRRPGLITGP
jgi:uncharacterized protein YciI